MTPIERMELLIALREDRQLRAAVTEAVMQTVAEQVENRKARHARTLAAAAKAHGATAEDVEDRVIAESSPASGAGNDDPFAAGPER